MEYPKEFKEKVKNLYPNSKSLHRSLEEGGDFVGRFLDDNRHNCIDLDKIINCNTLEKLQDLKSEAKVLKIKNELYGEWWDLWAKKER